MDTKHLPSKPKPSHAPSWIMLGFIVGALFMHTFYPRWFGGGGNGETVTVKVSPTPVPTPTPRPTPAGPNPNGPSLMEVEAIFNLYRADAIWDNDRTEIAIWNRANERFSEFFLVQRTDDGFFFRTITSLTRPVMEYQGEEGRPIRFTEPAAQRERRMQNVPMMFRTKPPEL